MEKLQKALIPIYIEGDQETVLLASFKLAQQSFSKATTIEKVSQLRLEIKALEALSKEFRVNQEIQLDITELRIRIEKRLGQMLREVNSINSKNGHSLPKITENITLSEIGITKYESLKFQQIAGTKDSDFENALTDLRVEAIGRKKSSLSITKLLKYLKDSQKHYTSEFSSIIKPSDNWNFSSIRYARIDDTLDDNWGYIPGDLYANCFWYYVKPNDSVVIPMAGSGQAQQVYDSRQEWMGKHIYDFNLKLFDLNPRGRYQDKVIQHDIIQSFPINNPDYILMDIPYYGISVHQYSHKSEDLANMNFDEWKEAMSKISKNCSTAQRIGKLCTIISPNYRDISKGEIILVTDVIRKLWESSGYMLYDKAYSSRKIQQRQHSDMARINNKAKANRTLLTDITEILTFKKI